MKSNVTIIAAVVLFISSCSTGTYVTKTFDDDIYFSPGDIQPSVMADQPASENQEYGNQQLIISQMDDHTVTNYVYESDDPESGAEMYDMDQMTLVDSDTTAYYNEDDVKYVINNYYDGDDIDYAYRIRRFHNPYFYDPFYYDDWYFNTGYYGYGSPYSYYSWGNWGLGLMWSPSYYGGWYSPYYYSSWYWPGYYSMYPYNYYGWNYPYYAHNYYGGHRYNVERRHPANLNTPQRDRNSYTTTYTGGGGGGSSLGSMNSSTSNLKPTSNPDIEVQNGHSRSRITSQGSQSQTDNKSATIVNNRTTVTNSGSRDARVRGQNNNLQRPSTVRQSSPTNVRKSYEPSTTSKTYQQNRTETRTKNYTPSYSKPRIVTQSNYNNNRYARPTTTNYKNQSNSRTYSAPKSTSNMKKVYRSSSSYSSGSSSRAVRSAPSYNSSPTRSSSGASYRSAPSRSSVGSSSSSGRSSSSGSSSSGSGRRR